MQHAIFAGCERFARSDVSSSQALDSAPRHRKDYLAASETGAPRCRSSDGATVDSRASRISPARHERKGFLHRLSRRGMDR